MGRRVALSWLVVGALLVGCGSGGDSVAIEGLGAVAAAAEEAGSARLQFRMDVTFGGQSFSLVGEGVTETATGVGAVTMRGRGPIADAIGENELLIVDDTMYVRGALAQPYAPGVSVPDGHWVAVDVSSALAVASQQQASMADFRQLLDAMRAAGSSVKELGQQRMRDIDVHGYRATLTMQDLYDESGVSLEDAVEAQLQMQPPATRDQLRPQLREQLDTMARAPITLEAWVDGEQLPRRITMQVDLAEALAAAGAGDTVAGAGMTMAFDVLEYGVPVDVQAPPSDQVIRPA